jgi:Xaa-Pro aminopeptidase
MPAYGSIVAAGRNSCILHYQQNDALLKDGDLVLIDAGCEIDCYASDITRTWPVNGKFSPEEGDLRNGAGLPGSRVCRDRPEQALEPGPRGHRRVITAGLVELGLLQGDVDELIASEAYKPSTCTAPATGWAWMCMTSANTKWAANGACWKSAWR